MFVKENPDRKEKKKAYLTFYDSVFSYILRLIPLIRCQVFSGTDVQAHSKYHIFTMPEPPKQSLFLNIFIIKEPTLEPKS